MMHPTAKNRLLSRHTNIEKYMGAFCCLQGMALEDMKANLSSATPAITREQAAMAVAQNTQNRTNDLGNLAAWQ